MTKIFSALLTLSLLGGAASQAQAQAFTTEVAADTVMMEYSAGAYVSIYNRLKANNEITVNWKMVDYSFSNGWTLNGFCDNKLCYGSTNVLAGTSHTTLPFGGSGDSMSDFHAQINGSAAASNSSSYITIEVTEPNSGHIRTLTFIAYKGASTAVSNTAKTDPEIQMYPKPAREALNITFDESAGIQLASIYNLIGKAVSIYRVQGNSAKFDVSTLPAGMYLLRLMGRDGSVIATRKFTHQ